MHACRRCGTVLTGYGPAGLCPRCLLHEGLGASAEAASPATPGPPLRRFGDYELLEEIACGGMGIVYRARQLSLNRIVAVKMMLAGPFARPEFVQRFRAEAAAAASLQHPHIVAVHDVGEQDGQPFFSMDLVEGQNLADLVRAQPLGARRAAGYLKTIAEAVHFAHQHGVLHRDLKPSNILVDQYDQPRITDFGLAKRLDSDAQPSSLNPQLTLTGQVLGSPNYLPPEQAEGRHRDVGPASDVYSLGAVLYHLLTGRPPFQAETLSNTLQQVTHSEPVSPRVLNPSASKDLETICLKCLEKDQHRRYPTAQALAQELGRFLHDEPIQAQPVGVIGRTWRWCRRKPVVAGLVAGLILTFLAGFLGVAWHWHRAEQALGVSRESLWQANFERSRALRLSGQMGQRVRALEAIRQAAALRPSAELRNEAIAALALPDLEDTGPWHSLPVGASSMAGNSLAYTTPEDHVRVCRLIDGASVLTITNRAGRPYLRLSRDGSRIAAYGNAKSYVVELTTGRTLWEMVGRCALDLTPDGRRLVHGTSSNTVVMLDLDTGQEVGRLEQTLKPIHAAVSPQGNRVALWDYSAVEVWNLDTGRKEAGCKVPTDNDVAWRPDGATVAIGCQDNQVRVWSWTDQRMQELRGHSRSGVFPCYHPKGDLLASFSWDMTLRLWDPANGDQLAMASGLRALGFSSDGQWLAAVGQKGIGRLRVHRSSECRMLHAYDGYHDANAWLEFSPDNRWLIRTSLNRLVLWDTASGQVVEQRIMPGLLAGWFWDTRTLVTFGREGAQIWINSGSSNRWQLGLPVPLLDATDLTYCLPVPSLDQLLICRGVDASIFPVMRSTSSDAGSDQRRTNAPVLSLGQPRLRLPGLFQHTYVEFHPSGPWIAAGSWNNAGDFGPGLSIWSATTGHRLRRIPIGNSVPYFSPDGQWFLAAGAREYRLFEVQGEPGRWPEVRRIPRQSYSVVAGNAAFAGRDPWLAVQPDDQEIQILEVPSGRELARLPSPWQQVSRMAWSHDGRWLAADSRMGTRLWDLHLLRSRLRELGLDW